MSEASIDREKLLEFHQLVLPKETVASLSARDKKRLLMLTSMMRDMDLYRKMLIYGGKQKTGNAKIDETVFVTLIFSTSKILISKVYEVWKFVDSEKIVTEKEGFSENLLCRWNEVEAFFSEVKNKKLFSFIRNKFGFHFDHYQEIEAYIEKAMEEVGDLEFWMGSDSSGNDVFSFSNTVMLTVLRNKMTELGFVGNEEALIGQLQKLPIIISHSINEFCKGYLTEVLLDGKIFHQKLKVDVMAPLLSEVNLPWIVKNDLNRTGQFL
ncbi:MAG: hypothetical protein KJ915_06770 [Candidatus Omnitrophica bacterium]|nr:hypothetical protein [Candidatus Omnitrophota bacterium]